MAMATRNEFALKMSPLQNGRDVDNDEECVQIMWNAVRNTYDTDMKPLTFKQMNYADSYKWADALKDYIDEHCKVEDDSKMRVPDGSGVQIWRKLTIQLDQTRVLDLGPMTIAQKQQHSKNMCVFSRNSYRTLERYIENMRQGMQRSGQSGGGANARQALALALMLAALNTDDD